MGRSKKKAPTVLVVGASRISRPAALSLGHVPPVASVATYGGGIFLAPRQFWGNTDEIRTLARWLLRAADWLDHKKEKSA